MQRTIHGIMTRDPRILTPESSCFTELLCGSADIRTPLGKVIHYVADSGGRAFSNLLALYHDAGDSLEVYGAYQSRLVLEVAATAVIGRLDPFRLLVLAEVQKAPSHEIGKPNSSSIRWQGDVFGDGKVDWNQDRKLESFSRALLGDCWERFAWQHALETFIDNSAVVREKTEWMAKICGYEPHQLVPVMRTHLARLYSSLSKGIHLEFVSPPQDKFDEQTLSVAIEDVIFWSVTMLTLSNFVDHAAYKLPSEKTFTLLTEAEKAQKGQHVQPN